MNPIKIKGSIPQKLFLNQVKYCDDQRDSENNRCMNHLPPLKAHLTKLNLEHHYFDIIHNIFGPLFKETNVIGVGIVHWAVEDVSNWIKTLTFLLEDCNDLDQRLEEQMVDGYCFMIMDEKDWLSVVSSKKIYQVMTCIRRGWLGEWGDPMESFPATKLQRLDNQFYLRNTPEIYGRLVVLGTKV